MSVPKGPVLIDLEDDASAPGPDTAPPVPDDDAPAAGAAMQRIAAGATRPRNKLAGWFWGLLGAILAALLALSLWSAVEAVLARSPVLATLLGALLLAFAAICGLSALREAAAFARLGRIDRLQRSAAAAHAEADLSAARTVAADIQRLYSDRPELRWAGEALPGRIEGIFDADAVLAAVETDLLAPLDARARAEVEAAARRVATVTALVPLALADVVAALSANLGMIRRIAEIYGGRAGTLGTWRLMRAVLAHLVATGAVAVGDDLIHSVAGGSVLSRVSRRFGEGVVNGALTARVGVAAMEVCRPLPFRAARRPSVTSLVHRALTGLFGQGG